MPSGSARRSPRRSTTAWYDEADLYTTATRSVEDAAPEGLRNLVLYLPLELPGRAIAFVRALGARIDVRIVSQLTGDSAADADTRHLVDALGAVVAVPPTDDMADRPTGQPVAIVTTTDADEEVREATRLVVETARSGTPFERIAVLWPAQRPYARLVEHHLTAAAIPWNGRPGTTLAERSRPASSSTCSTSIGAGYAGAACSTCSPTSRCAAPTASTCRPRVGARQPRGRRERETTTGIVDSAG